MPVCKDCGNRKEFHCLWLEEYKGDIVLDDYNDVVEILNKNIITEVYQLKVLRCSVCNSADIDLGEKLCPDCGGKMILKKGKHGAFLGCDRFPQCKHTEKI
ncbi:MAG: topoisomerase DNA-binding C4 zinc finger domain-containing protein [Paludibacter sp.]